MNDIIEIRSLVKRYGSTRGVEGLDLQVAGGEVFGFLGPNGAGKTTTIRCMLGLLRPTSGHVRLLGFDPITQHRQLAPRIGYLPGELRLYSELTGAQHLDLLGTLQGTPLPRQRELCERLGLTSATLARPISGYSRGMKQKIGLVQAFQHNPDLVILDEPTEGLDPLVQQEFFTMLDEMRSSGGTVLLSSHVLSEVQRTCQRVAIMREGQLVSTQEVSSLRDLQARQVRCTFPPTFDPASVTLDAAWAPTWSGKVLHLTVPPDRVVDVLRRFLDLGVVDVLVEEADLDEAFLTFYRKEAQA